MLHQFIETFECSRRVRWLAEAGIDCIGTNHTAVHRQQHAGRKHRIDEGIGVTEQQIIGAVVALRNIGKIPGRLDFIDQRRHLQAFGQRFAHGNAVAQELFNAALSSGFHEIRPGHHADAGDVVHHRNEPEPAMLEPENTDIAFSLTIVPDGAGKVTVNG